MLRSQLVGQAGQRVHAAGRAGAEDDHRAVRADLVEEASGKGVLRAIRRKHGPAAFDAIIGPILQEIGREAPIRSTRYSRQPGENPLTA